MRASTQHFRFRCDAWRFFRGPLTDPGGKIGDRPSTPIRGTENALTQSGSFDTMATPGWSFTPAVRARIKSRKGSSTRIGSRPGVKGPAGPFQWGQQPRYLESRRTRFIAHQLRGGFRRERAYKVWRTPSGIGGRGGQCVSSNKLAIFHGETSSSLMMVAA